MLTANYHLHFISFSFPRRDKDYWKYIILTSNLLSRLAFLKAEVTELASFSAIHALKSFTAKEAAIPVGKNTQNTFQQFSTWIRDGYKNYKVTKWLQEYGLKIHLWQQDQTCRAEMLIFFFNAVLIFWSMLDCLKIFSFCTARLHSIVQRFSLQIFFLPPQFTDQGQCKRKNYALNQLGNEGTK